MRELAERCRLPERRSAVGAVEARPTRLQSKKRMLQAEAATPMPHACCVHFRQSEERCARGPRARPGVARLAGQYTGSARYVAVQNAYFVTERNSTVQ